MNNPAKTPNLRRDTGDSYRECRAAKAKASRLHTACAEAYALLCARYRVSPHRVEQARKVLRQALLLLLWAWPAAGVEFDWFKNPESNTTYIVRWGTNSGQYLWSTNTAATNVHVPLAPGRYFAIAQATNSGRLSQPTRELDFYVVGPTITNVPMRYMTNTVEYSSSLKGGWIIYGKTVWEVLPGDTNKFFRVRLEISK